jgi:hypothetical protein
MKKKKKKRFDWAVTRNAVTVATPELETMGTINMENNNQSGANLIKLFTTVIYHHSILKLVCCVIKLVNFYEIQ